MNRIRAALAATFVLLPTLSLAQPGAIRIRQGERLEYNVSAEIEVTELVGAREQFMRAETGGIAHLTARRVSRRTIEWSYETPEIRLIRVSSGDEPGAVTETTVEPRALRMSTDTRGRLVAGPRNPGGTESLASLVSAMNRSMVKLWFQPAIFRKLKPGDTWTEHRDERIKVDDLGIDVRARYDVGYRFDGIVDTLGTRAIRVTWRADGMSIAGTRTVDGQRSSVTGDGDHFGTSYFSTIDGLVLATVSENTVDIRVPASDGARGVIPMTWRLRSASIRR